MNIIPDIPLTDIGEDRLGRGPMVDLIVESINRLTSADRHPCTVYGIYGKWGEGKTSLMHFVKSRLEAQWKGDGVKLVEFNPWLVNNDEALLREFFTTIISFPDDRVRMVLRKYGPLVSLASKTIVNAVVPGVGAAIAGGVDAFSKAFDVTDGSLSDLKGRVSQAIVNSKRHLVVMIDDVDRLDKEELHAVLRLIRQVADFDNCIYIVAMDDEMVAKSIGTYHGGGSPADGRKFLDKIVQVPITLPQIPESTLGRLIRSELAVVLNDYVAENEIGAIVESVRPFIATCRELKRFCNQLSFVLPHLRDEVNIKDLCLLEAIKMVSAESYHRIIVYKLPLLHDASDIELHNRDKEAALAETEKRYKAAKEAVMQGLDNKLRQAIDDALDELFEGSNYEYQNDLDKKRLRTKVYFAKYFTLTVPSELIPDRNLNLFAERYRGLSVEDVARQLDEWVDSFSVSEMERAVLYMIRKSEYGIGQCAAASIMAKSLSVCKLAKGVPFDGYARQDVAVFVPVVVITGYMLVQDKDYAAKKVCDAGMLDDTLGYIFKNAELNYCMHFLVHADSFLGIDSYNGSNVLPILVKRFLDLTVDEQFRYSGYTLTTFLRYWKCINVEAFNDYAVNLFENPDIPCSKVFDKFIDVSDRNQTAKDFVELFQNQIPQINNRLEKEGDDVRKSKPVIIYKSACRS